MTELTIRDAVEGDIPKLIRLYDLARSSMKAMGTDQWQDGSPNGETALEDIRLGISRVVERNGLVIATAAAYVGHEPTYDTIYDGAWSSDARTYGIIHRIAIDPESKRQGVGSFMMEYCAGITLAAGLSVLRCDTHAGNAPMRAALEKNGYVYRGVIRLGSGAERVAYEKLI